MACWKRTLQKEIAELKKQGLDTTEKEKQLNVKRGCGGPRVPTQRVRVQQRRQNRQPQNTVPVPQAPAVSVVPVVESVPPVTP